MRTTVVMVAIVFAGLAAIVSPSFAHHGAAAFDMNTPVVLKNATVTEFVWINPHPLIKADYKNEKGEVEHWPWKWAARCPLSSLAGPERR